MINPGDVYNYWTVLAEIEPVIVNGHKMKMCMCKCKCGVEKAVYQNNLVRGLSKSCGCIAKDKKPKPLKDLSGKVFGELTVIGEGQRSTNNKRTYRCLCSCGKYVDIIVGNLMNGNSKTCGDARQHYERNKDITGVVFGRLTAICRDQDKITKSGYRLVMWKCTCSCGNEKSVSYRDLASGNTISCGCREKETWEERVKASTTHGGSKERLYFVWRRMLVRCNNPNDPKYKSYGGSGVSVCEEWKSYEKFREWALDNGYDKDAAYGKCTIDRIDPYGNYCPENCRWVDMHIQALNKRSNYMNHIQSNDKRRLTND